LRDRRRARTFRTVLNRRHPSAHSARRRANPINSDLRDLIEDPRFLAYHRERAKPREFNTFDVLQYADYEIRHSNVLAWLLRPGDTHGIGARFLRWFVDHVNGRLPAGDRVRVLDNSFEQANVDVWRERERVDITIRFKREKCLIAVENKLESASSDHLGQVMGYDRMLRGKHENHTVGSVLLSASADGSVKFPDIAHVGWDSVGGAIGSILADGGFPTSGVQPFIRQYVDMVDRWLHPAGGGGFKALLEDHRSVLKEMRRVLEKDGDDGVRGMVTDRAEHRDSLVRLVRESRHDPKKLQAAVAAHLKGRVGTLKFTNNPSRTVYWLRWREGDLGDALQRVGGPPDSVWWEIAFSHHNAELGFFFRSANDEERSFVDRMKNFVETTPINRQKPDGYSLWDAGQGFEGVYHKKILSHEDLVEMSAPEAKDQLIQRLKDFMDSDDSEYRRIDDYFQCLAFGFEAA